MVISPLASAPPAPSGVSPEPVLGCIQSKAAVGDVLGNRHRRLVVSSNMLDASVYVRPSVLANARFLRIAPLTNVR